MNDTKQVANIDQQNNEEDGQREREMKVRGKQTENVKKKNALKRNQCL